MQLLVWPFGMKQRPGRREEEPVTFEVEQGLPLSLQFPCRLEQHLRLRQAVQAQFPELPIAVGNYVVCPLANTKMGFEDREFKSSK